MSFPRYPEYTDSGVEWLGEVPNHWAVEKIKHFTSFFGGGTPSRDVPSFWNGDLSWVSPKDMKVERLAGTEESITAEGLASCAAGIVAPGAVLMVVRSGILRHTLPVAINVLPVALNQDMKALVFSPDKCRADFFLRWVQGLNDQLLLAWAKQGATVESIEHDYLANANLPLPPLAEQSAIAAFLDRETGKIDALVAEQEKLIELLKEKRQAVISNAVTKGLDPNVPMKDSGVEWLGEVPAHWEVVPLRRLLNTVEQGWSPQSEAAPAEPGEPAIIKLSAIKDGLFAPGENKSLPVGSEYDKRYEISAGDLLLTRANTPDLVGECCVVHESIPAGLLMPDLVYRLKTNEKVITEFLKNYLRSAIGRSLIAADARGSSMTMAKISQEHIRSWVVTLPPLDEQQAIVRVCEDKSSKLTALITEAQQAIDLLKERRSALISASVTGKIDVRGLVGGTSASEELETA